MEKINLNKKVEKELNLEKTLEVIKRVKILFILAHWTKPEEKLSVEARLRSLAAIEAKNINPSLKIVFVGGHVENAPTNSRRMAEYFGARSYDETPTVLDKSNNTVGNIREIIEYLDSSPQELREVAILSSPFHLQRVAKILSDLGKNCELISYDPLFAARSEHHDKFIEDFQNSIDYKKMVVFDKIMMAYLKLDPEQRLVAKLKDWVRNRKNQNQ